MFSKAAGSPARHGSIIVWHGRIIAATATAIVSLLAFAACNGNSGSVTPKPEATATAETSPAPTPFATATIYSNDPNPAPAQPIPVTIEDRFDTIVMSFQGGGDPQAPPDTIAWQGLELVVGAEQQYLELVASITVTLPDGTTRDMASSADVTGLPGPSGFWGYYGTNDGLQDAGDFVFDFLLTDGRSFVLTQPSDGKVIDIPRNIAVRRDGDELHISWDAGENVRNYSAQIYESKDGGTIRDSGVNCETGSSEQFLVIIPATSCTITVLEGQLIPGQEYLVSLGAFGHQTNTENGRWASYSGNHSQPFIWQAVTGN